MAAEETTAADLKAGAHLRRIGQHGRRLLGGIVCKSYPFLIGMYFLFASVFNSGAVSILVLSFFSSGFSGGDGSEDEGGDGTGGSGGRKDMDKGQDVMDEAEEMTAGEMEAAEQEQQEVAEEAKVRIRGKGGCG